MEVIGVLAVIAIIASVAAPQVFQAISDAKVTSVVQEAHELKAAVARYYKDTGTWPRHIPSRSEPYYNQLMQNENTSGEPVRGWDGPYLESQLSNPIQPEGYVEVLVTDAAAYACDLDGNGELDGKFVVYRIDGVDDQAAKDVSNTLDDDGNEMTGDSMWSKAGRVKRYNGDHAHVLLICLARV